ncbi:uncharacterized protein K02A2.6-like [Ornithodoros turicata]|uniref:uncharacterized protein K02A2.6-like n=1 Tax=Ornithodoros turicata TaxID=34597 RepID=UPI003139A00B
MLWLRQRRRPIKLEGINQMKPPLSKLETIMSDHASVFADSGEGHKGPPVGIALRYDAVPQFRNARPVPFALRRAVEHELKYWESHGFISPVQHSDWATPVVIVRKKDGGIRLCGDYKTTVNAVSKKASLPLPSASEILANLQGGTVFSTLDLAQAYQQLRVTPETAQILTINTLKGLYAVHRLPFGVSAAPAIFQRYMETVLAGIPGTSVYLDDVIITRNTRVEHDLRLKEVLERLKTANLRLKKSKCRFAVDEVCYQRHRINVEGVHTTQEEVQVLLDAPEPTSKTELQSFLGLLTFYDKFLPNMASVAIDLYELLAKDKVWKWEIKHREAYARLKNLEGLAVVFAVAKFHQYVAGRHVTILTDHKPLLGILGSHKPIPQVLSPRMTRWCLRLAAYDYDLVYRKGPENQNADCMSRLPLQGRTDEPYPLADVLLLEGFQNPPLTMEELRQGTQEDAILSVVFKAVQSGDFSRIQGDKFKPFARLASELSIHEHCLVRGTRVVVPPVARQKALELIHAGHRGMVAAKACARSYMWWPRIDSDIENRVRDCNICKESRRLPPRIPSSPFERASRPWQVIHLDCAGPCEGHMLLVIVGAYTKWLEWGSRLDSQNFIETTRTTFMANRHGFWETTQTLGPYPSLRAKFGDISVQSVRTCAAPYNLEFTSSAHP